MWLENESPELGLLNCSTWSVVLASLQIANERPSHYMWYCIQCLFSNHPCLNKNVSQVCTKLIVTRSRDINETMNTFDKNIIIAYAGLEDGHGENSLNHSAENFTKADLYCTCKYTYMYWKNVLPFFREKLIPIGS